MRPSRLSPWLALSLAACVAAPPVPPHVGPVTPPSRLEAPAANADHAEPALDRWWMAWGDPALDRLVDQALAANTDIRVAAAHVAAARALVAVAEGALYPTVSADGAAWGVESNTGADQPFGSIIGPYGNGNEGHVRTVSLGASWEPDVFGGRHADIAVAKAIAESATHGEEGVRLAIVADVVENYQEHQGLRRRLAILDRSIAVAGRLADYAVARMRSGQATAADVTDARNEVEALTALRGPIVSLIDARRRRLAVLAGNPPETAVAISEPDLVHVPDAPGGQVPSAILERRPDVRARAAMIEAEAARVRRLKADLKPRFAVHFIGQSGKIELSGLPGFGGSAGAIGLTASAPIFTGGRLRARVAAGNSELEAAFASYDRTVLAALEEVEGAYGFRMGLDDRLDRLKRASALSAQHAGELDALYKSGRVPLAEALRARLAAIEDEDRTEQARMASGTAAVQLYRALGGGWGPSAGIRG